MTPDTLNELYLFQQLTHNSVSYTHLDVYKRQQHRVCVCVLTIKSKWIIRNIIDKYDWNNFRVSIELSANVCVRPTPSRGSSVDSQCSSTSSHSHGLVASQALTESQPVPAYENLNMDHIARLTSEGNYITLLVFTLFLKTS